MSLTVPPSLVVPFADSGDKNTIPVPTQVGVDPGAASYETGFPPATMTDPTLGGVPPSGFDMNGVLNMISAHTAWLAAGGFYTFNADVVTYWTGYPVGAIVRSLVDSQVLFYNTVADNANDPDAVLTGWIKFRIGGGLSLVDQGVALPAGTTTDQALTSANVGRLNLTTFAGDAVIDTLSGGELGQIVTIAHGGPSLLTLTALGVGTGLPFYLPADMTLVPNQAVAFRMFNNAWYPL